MLLVYSLLQTIRLLNIIYIYETDFDKLMLNNHIVNHIKLHESAI
jgi:hypothetical protein